MRDTRESRLLLVLLVAIAFALITVDIRGGEESPIDGARTAAAKVFGPAEDKVSAFTRPVGDAISAVRDSGGRAGRVAELERENAQLKEKLGSSAVNRSRVAELDKLLKTAGAGRYTVKAAQIIAIGAAQGFSWTVTIDAGSMDGLTRDMTVLNGDGLVGRVTTVGPSTATVLLANDPDFTVGTRLENSMELGFATGQGDRPLRVQLLNGKAQVKTGDRMVTFGSQAGKPFVPGVPVGKVVRVERAGGNLTRTVQVQPYVSFTRLDLVGVVVQGPRKDPRDSVLPPVPRPTPKKEPKASPDPDKSGGQDTRTGRSTQQNEAGQAVQPTPGGTAQDRGGGQDPAGTDPTGQDRQPEPDNGPPPPGSTPPATPTGGTGTAISGLRRG
ncbi:rod shape-determining protein MreC [Wenjunlia tyrosinilytica]|uniref:Cell shape-determining protein MreC n=1 Tax=Wenjunlia tyrosinilytica TaxID=1544741 RepID=A0A917ZD73_9ACTN|nr:rod shape-determining protein MreC [Wenjunlia tyrosinilytica]GGO80901.1 rod shape-determining protein MreC [Wenjunlia tyrosinilytica]